jgi:hypothetical protein
LNYNRHFNNAIFIQDSSSPYFFHYS